MSILRTVAPALVLTLATCGVASSQPATQLAPAAVSASGPPRLVLEGAAGWAGFGDEGIIHHTLAGAAWRGYVTRRISLGPEAQYMSGPGSDRDLILTGNVMVDLLPRTSDRPRRTTPFVVAGGGLFRHSNRFPARAFTTTGGAFTFGAGLRSWLSDRIYVGADARLGWAPHVRVAALVGVALE